MATQQANPQSKPAKNGDGQATPQERELTKEEHLQKANRLMEEAWDKIYNRKNKELGAS